MLWEKPWSVNDGLPGPVQALIPSRSATPFHPGRSGGPACYGQRRRTPDLGFMARLLALCSLPRSNPGRLQYARQWAVHALHDGERRQQATLRQPLDPGLGVHRSRADPKPDVDPGAVAGEVHEDPWGSTAAANAGIKLRNQMPITLIYKEGNEEQFVNSPTRGKYWWNPDNNSALPGWQYNASSAKTCLTRSSAIQYRSI